jgi:hypothetical protein
MVADERHGSDEPRMGGASDLLGSQGLLLVPLLLVGASLLRPDATPLRLGAVAAVLAVGHIWCECLHAAVMSREAAQDFTLHFGNFLIVVVLGTVLAIWWGWRSTAVILSFDVAWHMLSGLPERADVERPPETTETEQLPIIIKRLPPPKE